MAKGMRTGLILILVLCASCLVSCGETAVNYAYRNADCGANPVRIVSATSREDSEQARCAYQEHVAPDTPPDAPARYDLAFLEFGDHPAARLSDSQFLLIKSQIRQNRQAGRDTVLVAYVHGWRHDAEVNNRDVQGFRTMLNYTRSFLDQRGRMADTTEVLGVYIGWRGRQHDEETERKSNFPSIIPAAFTLGERKAISETLSEIVIADLRDIQSELDLDNSDDRMIVMGHSLGGNLLATGLMTELEEDLRRHGQDHRGQAFQPPLGNLTVLFNPAAESQKWTRLQLAMRDGAGLSPEWSRLLDPAETSLETLFPATQKPVYISITSICDKWGPEERSGDGLLNCDWATGYLFPLASHFSNSIDSNDRITIGYARANYYVTNRDGVKRWEIDGPAIGADFDIITNARAGGLSTYVNANVPDTSLCAPQGNWLYDARVSQIQGNHHNAGRGWDVEAGPRVKPEKGQSTALVQIRHDVSLPRPFWHNGVGLAPSVAPANGPLWNMRAHGSVIDDHRGLVNYPLWCVLNQILLDDVAAAN
ncbi:hypothetical protein [Maritimibacter alexandrii]|uniref:hypothetical protein n=1 Tax=Maritimibacter alexandrii TaxID=2570355 RepID=UPI001108D4F3|nr:hypothetical protein [Maritimibacter alexandrii]